MKDKTLDKQHITRCNRHVIIGILVETIKKKPRNKIKKKMRDNEYRKLM